MHTLSCPAAQLGKAEIVNVIQQTRSCLSLYWAAMWFYFIKQLCALCCVW